MGQSAAVFVVTEPGKPKRDLFLTPTRFKVINSFMPYKHKNKKNTQEIIL